MSELSEPVTESAGAGPEQPGRDDSEQRPVRGIADLSLTEKLNFLLTNRIPRRWATLFMGRLSRIENPVFTWIGIRLWQVLGGDLALHEAKQRKFASLQDCFTRELKEGARVPDPRAHIVTSPCDAIVGEHGTVHGTRVIQAKGFPYSLEELLPDKRLVDKFRDGQFVTLRLKSNMYHRFHAPADCRISQVTFVSGDTWNVNPIALRCVEKLFCRNERAVVEIELASGAGSLLIVPIAAILVASMRFAFLDTPLGLEYSGPQRIPCVCSFRKGDELGHFRLGSTVLVFSRGNFRLHSGLGTGRTIRMGEPLLEIRPKRCTSQSDPMHRSL